MGGAELVRKRDSEGRSALHYACEAGDVLTTAALLNLCPELLQHPDDEQSYPLHVAAVAGAQACVEELLERGARPDVKDEGERASKGMKR